MTHTFLLEVGLEDMPAGVIVQAEQQLVNKTKAFLDESHLSYGKVSGFSTPRRFAVMVEDLAEKQPDDDLTVRGPAQKIAQDEEGNWTKAAIGFSKGQGGSVDELMIKDEDGTPYVYIEKHIPGKETKELLKGLATVVEKIEFPKNMKWGTTNYHYVRPVHWLVALLDEEVVPFEVFGVKTSNQTEGHRFLGETITLNRPEEYEEKLKAEYVLPRRAERKAEIIKQIEDLCKGRRWDAPTFYRELLEEVTDLVEYPTAFYGTFDEEYLTIPDVVLETSMMDHQRYFPVREDSRSNHLLPYFISVRNGDDQYLDNVARGNEKVLTARLADAKFFYEEDQKSSIPDFVEQLKHVDYHDQLGTLYDKQLRAGKLLEVVKDYYHLSAYEMETLKRATSIYKFDLMTQMVDEFPTLQGVIGEVYALERGEHPAVAQAISEQYLPTSVMGGLPGTKLGEYMALIDKFDALIQFFSIGLIPTGSNDPYALRRQAIGVVRIMLDLHVGHIEVDQFINDLIQASELPVSREEDLAENKAALMNFIEDRLEQIMQAEYQIAHDVRQAALGTTHKNLSWMLIVAQILEEEKETEAFKTVVESMTRVFNMTENRDAIQRIDEDLLETDSEKALADAVEKLESVFEQETWPKTRYEALEEISPLISDFFDHNMIMVENEAVKENRLTLLQKLAIIAKQFADFSQLVI